MDRYPNTKLYITGLFNSAGELINFYGNSEPSEENVNKALAEVGLHPDGPIQAYTIAADELLAPNTLHEAREQQFATSVYGDQYDPDLYKHHAANADSIQALLKAIGVDVLSETRA